MTPTFVYQRGEPITFDIVVTSAGTYDPALLTCEVRIKPAPMKVPPAPETPDAAPVAVTFSPADGTDPAYWRGEVSASYSADLAPGFYAVDAQISLAGEVLEVTDYALINLKQSVTPA